MDTPQEHQSPLANEPAPDWVIDHAIPEPSLSDRGSSATQLLLRDEQHNLETATFFRRIAYHLPNFVSVQNGSRIEIEFLPESQRLLMHGLQVRRGDEVIDLLPTLRPLLLHREEGMERSMFDGRLLVVFIPNDVRPGDVIDYSYSLQATKPPLFGRTAGRFLMRSTFSAEAIRGRVLYSPQRKIYAMPHQFDSPALTAYTEQGLVDCRWEANGVQRIEPDDTTPAWALPFAWVDYGEFSSWEEVAAAASELFQAPAEPLPAALAEWIVQLRAAGLPDAQLIPQLIHYVQERVRYVSVSIDDHTHRPYSVSTILERHYGDCKDKAILLCRFLTEAGYEAVPALVHSRVRGRALDGLPRPGAFDHAIVQLRHAGKVYWIDATLNHQGGTLDSHWHPAYGAALVLHSPGAAAQRIPPSAAPNSVSHDELVKIQLPEGTAELRATRTFSGRAADEMRAVLATAGLAELDRDLLAAYKEIYREVKLLSPSTSRDDRERNQLMLTHHFGLSNFWTRVTKPRTANQARFPVHGIRRILRVPKNEKTIYPFRVNHPLSIHASMEIRLTSAFRPHRNQGILQSTAFQCKYVQETSSNSCRMTLDYVSTNNHVGGRDLPPHVQAIQQLANLTSLYVTTPERAVSRVNHPSLRR